MNELLIVDEPTTSLDPEWIGPASAIWLVIFLKTELVLFSVPSGGRFGLLPATNSVTCTSVRFICGFYEESQKKRWQGKRILQVPFGERKAREVEMKYQSHIKNSGVEGITEAEWFLKYMLQNWRYAHPNARR